MTNATVFDPSPAGFEPQRLARLRSLLQQDVDDGVIPGAVVLVERRGHLAWSEALGFAERDAGRPMRADSVFRIASLSKPITVAAALLLMEAGKLLLTDPLSRYCPALRELEVGVEEACSAGEGHLGRQAALRDVTILDLMRHTAGFTYGYLGDSLVQRAYRAANVMDGGQTNGELVHKLAQIPLAHQPGTTFEYGMSTDVLGHLIEVIADRSLGEFIARHIAAPLDMPDTHFGADADLGRLAQPRKDRAGRDDSSRYDPAVAPHWHSGGGGLLSTATDYLHFCRMLLSGGELGGARLLGRKTVELMLGNHLPRDMAYGANTAALGIAAPLPSLGQGYGLGLGVRTEPALAAVPGSVGDFYWGGASGPYFWVDPREQLIVIFMLQELDHARRARYRASLRALVYQALQ